MAVLLLLCAAAALAGANAQGFYHSLDGKSFTIAGTVEGEIKDGEATVVRTSLSQAESAQLQALAEQDQFYTVRVGQHATASVRASCYAAPADTIHERLSASVSHGHVTGITYLVSSPGCQAPVAAGTSVQRPSTPLTVDVVLPVPGPQLLSERVMAGPGGTQRDPMLGNGGAVKGSAGGKPGGFANRPVGAMPPGDTTIDQEGTEGAEGAKPPAPEQSWLQKNWLFVAGGVMVALNVLTASSRQAPAAGGAAPAAAGGAARR